MFIPYRIINISSYPTMLNGALLISIIAIYVLNIYFPNTLQTIRDTTILGKVFSNFYHEEFFHVSGNIIALYFFGNLVSRLLGNIVYITTILVSIVISSAIDNALLETSIGASGIIYGFIGLSLASHPFVKFKFIYIFGYGNGIIILSLIWVVAMYMVYDLSGLLYYITGSSYYDNIAYWDHLSCLFMGFFIGYVGIRDRFISKADGSVSAHHILSNPKIFKTYLTRNADNYHIINSWVAYIILTSLLTLLSIYYLSNQYVNQVPIISIAYIGVSIIGALLVLFRFKQAYLLVLVMFAFNIVAHLIAGWNLLRGIEYLILMLIFLQSRVDKVFWPRYRITYNKAAQSDTA